MHALKRNLYCATIRHFTGFLLKCTLKAVPFFLPFVLFRAALLGKYKEKIKKKEKARFLLFYRRSFDITEPRKKNWQIKICTVSKGSVVEINFHTNTFLVIYRQSSTLRGYIKFRITE